jgi:probable phosphoglycerate mutase
MKVALIPVASTDWREEGRLLGRVELPPNDACEPQCAEWAEILRPLDLKNLFHAPDELATRTAKLLGRRLVVPTKASEGLAEVDVGLWAGLTDAQLKSRYAKAHRTLCEAPLNVSPPGGEPLEQARSRLGHFLKKQVKRNGAQAIGLVLRPVALAMTRCALEGSDASAMWDTAQRVAAPVIIQVPSDATRSVQG